MKIFRKKIEKAKEEFEDKVEEIGDKIIDKVENRVVKKVEKVKEDHNVELIAAGSYIMGLVTGVGLVGIWAVAKLAEIESR